MILTAVPGLQPLSNPGSGAIALKVPVESKEIAVSQGRDEWGLDERDESEERKCTCCRAWIFERWMV